MNDARNSRFSAVALSLFALGGMACSSSDGPPAPSEAVSALSCPAHGSPQYSLLYSDATADWDKVIATNPAFVVLGDHKTNTDSGPPAYFHNANKAIQVLVYIPMNYAHSYGDQWLSSCSKDYTLHHSCDNAPMSWDCSSISISQRIQNAMASGYDGVFFDETPTDTGTLDYVHDCAARVKQAGANKLVIMNPGTAPPAAMFDNNVDIVSVEHSYDQTDFSAINASPWRWLAVEDAISDLTTAKAHFDSFRAHHGFWYDASPSYSQLAPFYSDLASYIVQQTPTAPCSTTVVPPPTPSPTPAPTGPSLAVHTYDLDNGNAEINGLWTVVTNSAGKQTTGFSPLSLSLAAGTYSVSTSNYAPYTFSQWSDGSTAQPRSVSVQGATTLSSYYHSKAGSSTTPPPVPTTASVVVHAYDLDKGNAEVSGLWSVVTDSTGKQTTGFSPLTVTVPTGTVSVTVSDFAPYAFSKWDDGTTARPRSISVSGNTTVAAYYHDSAAPTTAAIVVHSYDLDNGNREITGLWTVIVDASGKQTTGFSPLSLTVPVGTTSISLSDYPPYTFNHWDNGTTARPRSMNITSNISIGGYYHSH